MSTDDWAATSPSQMQDDHEHQHQQRMKAVRERLQHANDAVRRDRHATQVTEDWQLQDNRASERSAAERQRAMVQEEFERMMQQVQMSNAAIEAIVHSEAEKKANSAKLSEQVPITGNLQRCTPISVSIPGEGMPAAIVEETANKPKPKRPRSQSRRSAPGNGTSRLSGGALRSRSSRSRKLPVHVRQDQSVDSHYSADGHARHSVANDDVDNGSVDGVEGAAGTTAGTTPDTSLLGIVRRSSRAHQRINHASRVLGDKISLHCLSHQSLVALKREARPLAALVRNVGQTLRDVAQSRAMANTQLESALCDTLHETLEQWHTTVRECSAHMQRMQRFLEAMYSHLHQLTENVNGIQASFLQRQCHVADAAGHRAIVQGMIERRAALEVERNGGDARPTQLWGGSVQVQQLPMFLASRDICSTHASNSFKGINVEFTPRRRNTNASRSRTTRSTAGARRNKTTTIASDTTAAVDSAML